MRRKNEQLVRLQEELRGLRSRAAERETRARATLERALFDATGGEGARESVRRAESQELARAVAERDEAVHRLRAQLLDQEQRAHDARAEARGYARSLDDRERQLELLREKAKAAEAERSAEAAAAVAVAAARADESREHALEAELAQLRRQHASRLEAEHDEASHREAQLRRECATANARANAERARADELADALADAANGAPPAGGALSDRVELERAHAALERARADLAARDAALADARAALALAEQAAARNVAAAAHAELAARDEAIAELRAELEHARARAGGAALRGAAAAAAAAAAAGAERAGGAEEGEEAGSEAAEADEPQLRPSGPAPLSGRSSGKRAADGIRLVGEPMLGSTLTLEGTVGGQPLVAAAGVGRALHFGVAWVRVTPRGQSVRLAAPAAGLSLRASAADVGCVLRATVSASAPSGEEVTLSADSATVQAPREALDLLALRLTAGQIEFEVRGTSSATPACGRAILPSPCAQAAELSCVFSAAGAAPCTRPCPRRARARWWTPRPTARRARCC